MVVVTYYQVNLSLLYDKKKLLQVVHFCAEFHLEISSFDWERKTYTNTSNKNQLCIILVIVSARPTTCWATAMQRLWWSTCPRTSSWPATLLLRYVLVLSPFIFLSLLFFTPLRLEVTILSWVISSSREKRKIVLI